VHYDIAVMGAGASGMVASILFARRGLKVLLIERQSRGGKKILASGNGHCNIANIKVSKSNYYGKNSALIDSLIKEYNLGDIVEFFRSIGLELIVKDDSRVYPTSMQASIVLELLEYEIKRLNIKTIYDAKELRVSNGFNIEINGAKFGSKKLILATGSMAAPQLGGSSSGLEIAKSFGHSIITPLPALVSLNSKNLICKKARGVKLNVKLKLFIEGKEATSKIGDLLFTKYGVSGLSVLDISIDIARVVRAKRNFYLEIDFFRELSKKDFLEFLRDRVDKNRALPLNLWLGSIIHLKVANHILEELNLIKKSERDLNLTTLKLLVDTLKAYRLDIESLREFKYAEVALGGVDSKEIDLTMQSKRVKNLYFLGEVLDIIGDRGGYNFMFAWFSAFRVASS